jgi:hypothetical protein
MEMSMKKINSEKLLNSDIATETDENIHTLNKLDILVFNNGWNDKNEKLIVGIGYNCGIYKQLHDHSAKYYKRCNKIINLSLLILSVFLTTDSIINLLKDDALIIIQKVIIFIIAIISIMNNFLKYSELSEQHLYAANSFNMIYNDIRNMMCIYKKDRMNAVKYIQHTLKEYDHLEIASPEISARFIKTMEHKIKTDDKYKNISMPTDQFREIEVIIDKFDKDTNSENIEMGSFNVQNMNTQNKKSPPKNKFKINNMQNIEEIHECFKLDGDLCEGDNITIEDVQNYRKQGLDLQTQYEFNRFMKH